MPLPILDSATIQKACRNPDAHDSLDILAYASQLAPSKADQEKAQKAIYALAESKGIYCASLDALYSARARGEWSGATIPACNIRTLTYHFSYTFHKAILEHKLGPVIFEIALSEQTYTHQTHAQYATSILAGAIKAGYTGPVFLLGDHYQASLEAFKKDKETELQRLVSEIESAIRAGFYSIDIDASTLVNLDLPREKDQQKDNYEVTAYLTKRIRALQPEHITIAIGGEIGHIGGVNSTPADFTAFMEGYTSLLPEDMQGLSKIALQTGTRHGGTPLPDGSIAEVTVDTQLHSTISALARPLGLGGTVQHGASTLAVESLHVFPEADTLEIHLATGWQNILFTHMPPSLVNSLHSWVLTHLASERTSDMTESQFLYKLRKKAWGPCKKDVWYMSTEDMNRCMSEVKRVFVSIAHELKTNTLYDRMKTYYHS